VRLGGPVGCSAVGAFSLTTGFTVQYGARQLDVGEVFQMALAPSDGHLAGQERRHILHGGRVTSARFQTQGGIGGDAPFVTCLQ